MMQIFHTISDLKQCLRGKVEAGCTVGMVPTMGALHNGHASLVARSVADNDVTVVSIFLNPTQFNDPKDLERYPRTLQADCDLLQIMDLEGKLLLVFAPSVEEIYPEPDTRTFSYPPTDQVMEGARRPGHFNGVCQIVLKLFYIVQPNRAYFGEKDFQQIAVIRRMVEDLGIETQIVSCPVIREDSGLAMSSRNTLLSDDERTLAANIYRVLCDSRKLLQQMSVAQVEAYVVDAINAYPGLEVEYYSIVNARTLLPAKGWEGEDGGVVGCITVYCGAKPIRLIDHIRYV